MRKPAKNLTVGDILNISEQDFREIMKTDIKYANELVNKAYSYSKARRSRAFNYFEKHPRAVVPITYQRDVETTSKQFVSWADYNFDKIKSNDKKILQNAFSNATRFLSTKESTITNWKNQLRGFAKRIDSKTGFHWSQQSYEMFWKIAEVVSKQTSETEYKYKESEGKIGFTTSLQRLIADYMRKNPFKGTIQKSVDSDPYIQQALSELLPVINSSYRQRQGMTEEDINAILENKAKKDGKNKAKLKVSRRGL